MIPFFTSKIRFLLFSVLALSSGVLPARAQITSFQPAQSVLGQANFTADNEGAASASTFGRPRGIAIDPVTGKLFVSDSSFHRILRFSSVAAYQTFAAAEAVLGQPDMTSKFENQNAQFNQLPSASTLAAPYALAIDGSGRLWVCDANNHRVLRFDDASNKASGAAADGVLGQPGFITKNTALSQSGLNSPTGLAIDADGNLWVSDSSNNRVLRYNNAAGKSNGANADGVLGGVDFTTTYDAFPRTSAMFSIPAGLTIDANGTLWVIDSSLNRILRFDNAAGKNNGAGADAVLGQPNFETADSVNPPTGATLLEPVSATMDGNGTLWVSDSDNGRILGFTNAATLGNAASAAIVLGQANFVSSAGLATSARSIGGPGQIAVDSRNRLFVTDGNSSRVLRFSPVVSLSAPAKVRAVRGKATIRGTSINATIVEFQIVGKGAYKRAGGSPSRWTAAVRGLKRPTTKVNVRASSNDGQTALRTVKVTNKK